jgi:hypothetical protein
VGKKNDAPKKAAQSVGFSVGFVADDQLLRYTLASTASATVAFMLRCE